MSKDTAVFPTQYRLLTTGESILLKTLWEKEKMLVTSIFSFSHNVFKDKNHHELDLNIECSLNMQKKEKKN